LFLPLPLCQSRLFLPNSFEEPAFIKLLCWLFFVLWWLSSFLLESSLSLYLIVY
jgi:hypothetical protein